jgi:hypothetical protein
MTEPALELLKLQKEFNDRDRANAVAEEFRKPEWAARGESEIARDYADALRAFLA